MKQKKSQVGYDDNQEEMMRSILGKSYITPTDIQNLFNVLLLNTFRSSKGKKL